MKTINNKTTTFSLKSLEDVSSGDKEFLRIMITTLIQTTNEGLSGLKRSLSVNDWKSMSEYAHKICSPCLHVEAMEVYKLLKQIENNCRNQENLGHVGELVDKLEEETKLLINWAEDELKKLE